MGKPTSLYTEGRTIAPGLKAALVVVALGVLAVTVDHANLRPKVEPLVTDHAVPTAYAETTVGAFILPVDMHPTEGDVAAPEATF